MPRLSAREPWPSAEVGRRRPPQRPPAAALGRERAVPEARSSARRLTGPQSFCNHFASKEQLFQVASTGVLFHPLERGAGSAGRHQQASWNGTLVTTTPGRFRSACCSLSAMRSYRVRCHQCRSTSSGTATVSVRSGRCRCSVQM